MNKVLVTGINGFVGEHVARHFASNDYEVTGTARQDLPNPSVADSLDDYQQVDLLDETSVRRLDLNSIDAIIHLAGRSAVGESFDKPQEYLTQNTLMTYNLLDHAKSSGFNGRIVSVSTGALYDPARPLPLAESSRTAPNSPYAIGKLSAEAVAMYFRQRGLDTVIARPFNHIGPGQGNGFLLPDMYTQIHSLEHGDSIKVGNIETRRDYTDVRDIARAYAMLVEAEKLHHSIYNVCSDRSFSGAQILEIIKKVAKLEDITTFVDATKIRPNEIMDIRGSYNQLHKDTGWTPEIDIRQTIADFIEREEKK